MTAYYALNYPENKTEHLKMKKLFQKTLEQRIYNVKIADIFESCGAF